MIQTKFLLSCAMFAALSATSGARAQEASVTDQAPPARPADTAGNDANSNMQEIVVTAERREQSLQKLPTTASVLTGGDLTRQQVNNIDALTKSTPSLAVNDTGVAKAVNIRGVGKSLTAPGVQAGVAYYVDGVPLPNDLFLGTPFFDLSRIEVLRGPQGTLVGMNSTGGAILLVTQNPQYGQWGGSLEQSVGNYDSLRTRASVNVPIGERFGAHLAGEYERRDSFFRNVGPATTHPGNIDRLAVRGTLGGELSSNLQVFIRGEYIRNLTDGVTGKPIPGDPAPSYAPILAASPTDPFTLARDVAERYTTHYFRVSGEVRWDIGDFAQLRSVTGFQRGKIYNLADVDGSALPTQGNVTEVNEPVFSQEFNLVSKQGGPVDWVLGYFMLNQDTNGEVSVRVVPPNFEVVHILGKTRLRNRGVFGQATVHVSDRLNITGGLRYNRERHYFGPDAALIVGGGAFTIPLIGDNTDTALTGRLTVDYQVTPDHFLYATASRGFKGGGLNTDATAFGPETIWNYEAGLKSTLFDRHLRTQFSVFYYKNTGIQLQVYSPLTTLARITNAGSGHTFGLEGQAQAQFGDLGINLSASYTDTSFGDVSLFDQRYPSASAVQLKGRPFLYAPKFTANVGLEYNFHLGDYTLTPRAQYSHTSTQWATVFQVRPTDIIEPRDLVDLSLRLSPAGKGWTAELFATNLFDETYVASKSVQTADPGRLQFYGAPRQYGARVGFSF